MGNSSSIPFQPVRYNATCCNTLLYSKYSGEFVTCKCGAVSVDQTEHYERVCGDISKLSIVRGPCQSHGEGS